MTIKILPPQLANQIAAGEVVERPASVVKELVENSLDAGADHIEIDIDKGGSKLIRVRDNGCGVAEHELVLALSRHATSKIADLDDLERITSLGFRGEALASISSVSRLVLTSRPAEQDTAWQASAAGRDMAVEVKPAAHPVGTTIEVADLFFNTPARRRFLRTDKTEFSHIDELVRRLALSRYDVSWLLTHNGQQVRRLKAAVTTEQHQKRIAALCGRQFAEQALFIESEYDGIKLWGWLLQPAACHPQISCQYSYVNGRMMRDKLLNHAIRQAYGERLTTEQQPAFVLYLEMDPWQVDVNVHPAKHEVRFHQGRLVHDFVVSALNDALNHINDTPESVAEKPVEIAPAATTSLAEPVAAYTAERQYATDYRAAARPDRQAVSQQLNYLQSSKSAVTEHENKEPVLPLLAVSAAELVAENYYLLRPLSEQIMVIDLAATIAPYWQHAQLVSAPLLLPVRLKVSDDEKAYLLAQATDITALGFDFIVQDNILIARGVPVWLRQSPVNQWVNQWLKTATLQQTALPVFLLQLLLKAGWLSATTVITFFAEQLKQPQSWQAVPLQLEQTLTQFNCGSAR